MLGAVFALHLAVLVLMLVAGGTRARPPVEPGILSVVSLSAAPPAPAPPPPALPSKLAETSRPLAPAAAPDTVDAASTAAPGAGCATLDLVSKAILADQVALDAVHRAPPETRSLGDAILVWNGGWIKEAGGTGTPLGAVRAVAEASLRSLDEACLEEAVVGPRLIPIPAGSRMMFVVIGSGNWRWRDLLKEEPPPSNLFDWLDFK